MTNDVSFRKFTYKDFDALMRWIPSEEFSLQWAGPSLQYPLTYEQLTAYSQTPNSAIFTVMLGQVAVGHLSIMRIDARNESARIGRVLVGEQPARGSGIGEKMMRLALHYCFEELQLHRVTLGVYDFNKSAIHCYEKVGFRKEGYLRDSLKFGEQFWSAYEMSILRHEWLTSTSI